MDLPDLQSSHDNWLCGNVGTTRSCHRFSLISDGTVEFGCRRLDKTEMSRIDYPTRRYVVVGWTFWRLFHHLIVVKLQ
jgi:hypothetical protein